MRSGTHERKTTETSVKVAVNLDGSGTYDVSTKVGFFDHMLEQLSRHSLIDMQVRAVGDHQIDDHHTVEDVGIVLGTALRAALGDGRGIRRYGAALVPMDEALAEAAVDLSGRPHLTWAATFPAATVGQFDTELVREFFQAFANHAGLTLHVHCRAGANTHHMIESCFKAVARALRMAVEPDPRAGDAVPSTKGTLTDAA